MKTKTRLRQKNSISGSTVSISNSAVITFAPAFTLGEEGDCHRIGAEDRTVKIWNYVNEARYSPDGRRIVAACNFNDAQWIRVYDALSGNEL